MKEDLEGEIWKDVIDYEGLYQVSNLGRVYALPKKWLSGHNSIHYHNGKLLKHSINTGGYKCVNLSLNSKCKTKDIHKLVAEAFLGHIPCGLKLVVDHINDDPTDNRLENLQIVTNRFNTCKTQGKYSSKYKGVSWDVKSKKWMSRIYINSKNINLGLFKCELKAHYAYQQAIKELEIKNP